VSTRTSIEWTESTWNPVTGCTQVSPGCDHCYAKTIAERFRGGPAYPKGFDVTLRPHKLDQPLRWRRPRRIFVNSMSDLFHDDVPDDYIARVWGVMALAPRHTFQVLTKRHSRMRSLLSDHEFGNWMDHEIADLGGGVDAFRYDWPLPNVWLGVSTENQQWANIRIPALLDTPAAVRWISAEPLLGPIDLHTDPIEAGSPFWGSQLDWVVVGGESGHGARPMHPDWARSLRDQCTAAGVPFLFKQWGEWRIAIPGQDTWDAIESIPLRHDVPMEPGVDIGLWAHMRRVGKKAAGRQLDGETWDQYPEAVY
jgi:protein gp37